MAIVLKYGAPGPILAAGFAGGVGRSQQRQEDRGLELWYRQQQQGFQAQQAELDREQRAELQQGAFKFQADQNALRQDFQAEQAGLGREFQAGQQGNLIQARAQEGVLDRQSRLDADILDSVRKGELELPAKAQTELNKLDEGRVYAQSPFFSPEQQAEFMQNYETRRSQLLATARRGTEMSYDERVQKNLGANYDQYKELPWQFNNQGEMSLPSGFKMPGDEMSEADQKFNEGVMKRFEKFRAEMDDETGEPKYPDEDKALDAAFKEQETSERALKRATAKRTAQRTPASQTLNPTGLSPEQMRSAVGLPVTGGSRGSGAASVAQQPNGMRPQDQVAMSGVITAASSAGYVPVTSPEEAKQLKPGTRFIMPDGRTGTRK